MLVNRVSNLDLTWRQEIDELANRPSPSLELNLDDLGLRRGIEQLTFLEMKRNAPTYARFHPLNYPARCDESRRVGRIVVSLVNCRRRLFQWK